MTDIWTDDELEQYIQEGYDALVKATGCLWASDVSPDRPASFSFTSEFERDYIPAGFWAEGPFQFTSEFERDYVDNATGPANHTAPFEFLDGWTAELRIPTEISALVDLPEELYEIERSTWNSTPMTAMRSRQFEGGDSRYELAKGPVDGYTQDKDGLRRLRKWRVPSASYDPYDVDDDSSVYGLLVDVSEIDADLPEGTWGDFVEIAGEHCLGDPWGIVAAIYKEPNLMRYEYRRRGKELSDIQDFEIPVRYQVYVRHYAQARALEREGDGQDLELAAHFQARYEAGVARMLQRKQAMHFQRQRIIGGGRRPQSRLPLVRLPYNYGTVVR